MRHTQAIGWSLPPQKHTLIILITSDDELVLNEGRNNVSGFESLQIKVWETLSEFKLGFVFLENRTFLINPALKQKHSSLN